MKIVINRRFGGFNLSDKAVMRYAELKGIKLYRFCIEKSEHHPWGKFIPHLDEHKDCYMITYNTIEYINLQSFAESYETVFTPDTIDRNDPALVQVVDELGNEVNGHNADLYWVEIPNGVNWGIEEYDGMEWVAELHRTWGR